MSSDKKTAQVNRQNYLLILLLVFALGLVVGGGLTVYILEAPENEVVDETWVVCSIERIQIVDREATGTGFRILYTALVRNDVRTIMFNQDVAYIQVFHVGDLLRINEASLTSEITPFKSIEYELLQLGEVGLFKHSEEAKT